MQHNKLREGTVCDKVHTILKCTGCCWVLKLRQISLSQKKVNLSSGCRNAQAVKPLPVHITEKYVMDNTKSL